MSYTVPQYGKRQAADTPAQEILAQYPADKPKSTTGRIILVALGVFFLIGFISNMVNSTKTDTTPTFSTAAVIATPEAKVTPEPTPPLAGSSVQSQTDRAALPGERYPQTRQRLLTTKDLKDLTAAQVRYAINEIYARHGATFSRQIQQQFQKFDWYHPIPQLTLDDIDQSMSEIEKENVKVLAERRETLLQTGTKH